MGAKVSAEMNKALRLVAAGMAVYRAADKAEVSPSALFRAIKRGKRPKGSRKNKELDSVA